MTIVKNKIFNIKRVLLQNTSDENTLYYACKINKISFIEKMILASLLYIFTKIYAVKIFT